MSLKIIIVLFSIFVASCSSLPKKTKWTDPVMQVFIDPSIQPDIYVKIRSALVKSGKWVVVGRKGDFEAALREQNLLHKKETMTDRFENREKLAWLGKLKGARGAILAQQQCTRANSMWGGWYHKCKQHIAIMDVNTGEIIAVADQIAESDGNLKPDWIETVQALNEAYPENYEPSKEHKVLTDYKDESEVRSISSKEKLAREKINIENK